MSLQALHKAYLDALQDYLDSPSPQSYQKLKDAHEAFHDPRPEDHDLHDVMYNFMLRHHPHFDPGRYRIEWGQRAHHPYTEDEIKAAYPFITEVYNTSATHPYHPIHDGPFTVLYSIIFYDLSKP